jgi:hypothetical protein
MKRNIDMPPASIDAAGRSIDVVGSARAHALRNPFFGDPFDEELAMDPRAVRLSRGPACKSTPTRVPFRRPTTTLSLS